MNVATSGGRYTEIIPASSSKTPSKRVTLDDPRLSDHFSVRKAPIAMPPRHVASIIANAGARSAEASANTRYQVISNPSAMKPDNPARATAKERDIGVAPVPIFGETWVSSDECPAPRANRYAVPPTRAFTQAAIDTEPDCPKLRRRRTAHR